MRVEANELHGTDVKLVSLVKRGANRIPWKITKEDGEPMLDISKYWTRKTDSAPAAPCVHSAIMRKDAKDVKGLTAILEKSGLNVSAPVTKGDFIIFAQKSGEPVSDSVLIKSNADVGFVIENLSKAFSGYDFSSNDFNDVFSTGAFCPSVAMASDLLGVTIGNIMSSAETPAAASQAIAKAVEGFKQYSVTLANSLPVQAFKADKMMKGDVGMTLRGSGSTSYGATMDDKNNTGVNDVKPDKSLEDSENMKGFTDGMKRPNTNAGSTSISDAISVGTVDAKLGGPTVPSATEDDKKAVFQGNKVTGKGGKNPGIPTQKAEQLQKDAAEFASVGDHETATVLYKAADKILKTGGVVANTMADEGTDNSQVNKLKENQSGAGASSTNTGANVTKDASPMTNGNGTSMQATEDDANNTAVGATKKKPDPNLKAPDGMDANGWSAKIAADNRTMFAELTKSITGVVNSAIGEVRKEVTALAAQVTTMSGRIEKAEEAVNGTVHASPQREMLGFRTQKDEGDEGGIPAPLDTGLRKYDPEPNIAEIRAYARKGRGW